MANRPPPTSASRRRRVLVGAAIGWILVVVAGAGADADDSLLGVDNLDVVWLIFLGLALAFSIAFLVYLNPFNSEWVAPDKPRRGYGFWVGIALVVLLWVWQPDFLAGLADDDAFGSLEEFTETDVDTTIDEPAPDTVAQASDLLIIAAVLGVLVGGWYFLRRRSRSNAQLDHDTSDQLLETELAQALDEASIELAVAGDPRTAVLRSYAILEAVLATHGYSRTKAETTTEHLRRSLRKLRIDSAPLIKLGKLYELARFSEHPISSEQQADAAHALGQARASLASHL